MMFELTVTCISPEKKDQGVLGKAIPTMSLHKVFLLIGPVSIKAHGDPTAY